MTRSFLLCSSCFVLALPVCASAETKITTGGYAAFQAGFFNNDAGNNSGRDMQSEAEIFLTATTTTESGLTFGGRVELQTSVTDSLNGDEINIFLTDDWGRVELGDNDGPSDLIVVAPTVGIGQVNGSYDDYIPSADRAHALNNRGTASFRPLDTVDATKITYFTPRYNGWQMGLSYAPEARNSDADGETIAFSKTGSGDDAADVMELGLSYDNMFDDVRVRLGAGYVSGEAKSGTTEDWLAWGAGLQLTYKGFTVGGGYTRDGDSLNPTNTADDEVSSHTLGLTYEEKAWGIGLSYLQKDLQQNGYQSTGLPSDGSGGTYEVIAGGVVYRVAPGLTAGLDLTYYERDRATGTDTNGTVLVTDITTTF